MTTKIDQEMIDIISDERILLEGRIKVKLINIIKDEMVINQYV